MLDELADTLHVTVKAVEVELALGFLVGEIVGFAKVCVDDLLRVLLNNDFDAILVPLSEPILGGFDAATETPVHFFKDLVVFQSVQCLRTIS